MKTLLLVMFSILGPTGFAGIGGTAHLYAASSPTSVAVPAPRGTAPAKVAWYDASRPDAVTPAAPMPGVSKTDVLVEGLTINTSLLPISLPIPAIREVTAFTALQFHVPDGASPGSLTLHLTGFSTASVAAKLPSGVTPIACPATTAFKSGPQQPSDAAPKYDCSTRSTVGQIGAGGKTVVFPGISRLLTGNTLSVVILPGSLGFERLVFSAPDKSALSLLDFILPGGTSPSPVASPSCCSGPPATPPSATQPAVTVPLPSGEAVFPTAPEPVIASSSSSPAIATAALSSPDDHGDRIRALGLLLALIAVTAWLTLTDRNQPATEMGVGRFRSPRSGPPPTI